MKNNQQSVPAFAVGADKSLIGHPTVFIFIKGVKMDFQPSDAVKVAHAILGTAIALMNPPATQPEAVETNGNGETHNRLKIAPG